MFWPPIAGTKGLRRAAGLGRAGPALVLLALGACTGAPPPVPEPSLAEGDALGDARAYDFADFPPFEEIAPEAIAPDWGSHPDALGHAEAIREGAYRGAAFAGHLAVAAWPCGPLCRQYGFIDARDGRIIWGPRARHGAAFVQHSRLFVVDPPEVVPEGGTPAEPEAYVWTGWHLERLPARSAPRRRAGGTARDR